LATRRARGLTRRVCGVQVNAGPRDSVVGRNNFSHGPRAEPGLAEQIRLVRAWNAELGRGKKKGRGGGTAPAQTDEPVESEGRSRIERDREIEKGRAGSVMGRNRIG
jgi:hypothetical protein